MGRERSSDSKSKGRQQTALLATTLKARHRLPYADCFAAALARQQKAVLVTADKDHQSVQSDVNLLWIPGH